MLNHIKDIEFDEFEIDSDSKGWSDVDEIDESEQIMKHSKIRLIENEQNECWKCIKCNQLNNLKLTIEKYNMKCCGCENTSYIPENTIIIHSSKYDTPKDYILRSLVKDKVRNYLNPIFWFWICNQCTFKNENINKTICKLCKSKESIHKSTFYWICPYCKYKIKDSLDKCQHCKCKKPIRISHLPGLLTFGYCRTQQNNIAKDIQYLCYKFYGGRVEYYGEDLLKTHHTT